MDNITASNVSKRYGFQWIIKDFNAVFNQGKVYGIAGKNGSGKSTLIKILSGYLTPSKGNVSYHISDKKIVQDQAYVHITLAAPYTDLINEYTLKEMFLFHQKFKPLKENFSLARFEEEIQLSGQKDKLLGHFSSGMKQKIQLALSVFSDTSILLLDEPTSFLDANAKKWFLEILTKNKMDRIVIIASNDQYDLNLCDEIIEINNE
ncbi:MAG: ABC transporter ATP-binding protein [Saprospiraceae bacterium]|nr:ABC transporter ATP-binding protein [Saprospiraceae bacterium]